eukprot:1935437-Amphidinium_carterae.1
MNAPSKLRWQQWCCMPTVAAATGYVLGGAMRVKIVRNSRWDLTSDLVTSLHWRHKSGIQNYWTSCHASSHWVCRSTFAAEPRQLMASEAVHSLGRTMSERMSTTVKVALKMNC